MVQIDKRVQQALDKARSDEQVAELAALVRDIEPLKEMPGWKAMREHFAGYKHGAMLAIAKWLMAGEKVPAEKIAFFRGYATAIEDFFAMPEQIVRDMDGAALRAFDRAVDEAFSDENPPYK